MSIESFDFVKPKCGPQFFIQNNSDDAAVVILQINHALRGDVLRGDVLLSPLAWRLLGSTPYNLFNIGILPVEVSETIGSSTSTHTVTPPLGRSLHNIIRVFPGKVKFSVSKRNALSGFTPLYTQTFASDGSIYYLLGNDTIYTSIIDQPVSIDYENNSVTYRNVTYPPNPTPQTSIITVNDSLNPTGDGTILINHDVKKVYYIISDNAGNLFVYVEKHNYISTWNATNPNDILIQENGNTVIEIQITGV